MHSHCLQAMLHGAGDYKVLSITRSPKLIHWRVAKSDSRNVFFSSITYLMKHLISTIFTGTITGHRQSTAIFTNLWTLFCANWEI